MSLLVKSLSQRSVQTVLILTLYLFSASYLPTFAHQLLYTVSVFIKDLLVWIMPLTVAFFIAFTVASFEKKAPLFIILLLVFEALSNFTSVWYTYSFARVFLDELPSMQNASLSTDFPAWWRIPFSKPAWWAADKGCLVGLLLGCFSALKRTDFLSRFLFRGKRIMELILTRFFSRLIPIFILGFAAQLNQTRLLQQVFADYTVLLLWLLLALGIYLGLLFVLSAGFHGKTFIFHVRNLLPAGGAGANFRL